MLETERQKQSKMIEYLQTNASNTKDEMVRQILFLEKENEVLIEVIFLWSFWRISNTKMTHFWNKNIKFIAIMWF